MNEINEAGELRELRVKRNMFAKRSIFAIITALGCFLCSIIALFSILISARVELTSSVQLSIFFLLCSYLSWHHESWSKKLVNSLMSISSWYKEWKFFEFLKWWFFGSPWFGVIERLFIIFWVSIFIISLGIDEVDFKGYQEAIFVYSLYISSLILFLIILSVFIATSKEKDHH